MSDKGYNGWKNYETWCVNLWVNNDQGTQAAAQEAIEGLSDQDACEALREFVAELNPISRDASMFTDLIQSALSEVVWLEIVQALRED